MRFLTIIVLLLIGFSSAAQDVKKINKAIKAFDKDYLKGIEKLRGYMKDADYPSLQAYEVLVKMEYYSYKKGMEMWESISVTSTKEEGEEDDSTGQEIIDNLKKFTKLHFIDVCRDGSLMSFSHTADLYLRQLLIEKDADSLVTDEQWEIFEKGQEQLANGKMELAELEFRKALDANPDFYSANMYLGHSFWHREMYDSALFFYEKSKNTHPTLVDPKNCVVDCLVELGLYYRAKKECMEVMFVYPGLDAKYRFNQVLAVENKWINDHRFTRYTYPNDVTKEDQYKLGNHWGDYRNAKEKVSKYCNDAGIIEENGITKDKYLEVYSFRQMLDKNAENLPDIFDFPLRMKEEGFLEPFVFISMFHADFYGQFEDYMSKEENREKCREYIEKYLIEKLDS